MVYAIVVIFDGHSSWTAIYSEPLIWQLTLLELFEGRPLPTELREPRAFVNQVKHDMVNPTHVSTVH